MMLPFSKTRVATALTSVIFLLSLILVASGYAQSSKPTGEPSGPVTAKTALTPMYMSAFKWSRDVVLLGLAPKEIPGIQNGGGKAAIWEATYASPSQHAYHVYTYAVAAHPPDIYKGVTVGNAIPWAGPTREVAPIESSQFTVDSDAAYATAAADAEAVLKKNPGIKLTRFQLGNSYRFPTPVWYVMWGDQKSGYVAIVSATTGKVLKKK